MPDVGTIFGYVGLTIFGATILYVLYESFIRRRS
jgi:hypothetical protein